MHTFLLRLSCSQSADAGNEYYRYYKQISVVAKVFFLNHFKSRYRNKAVGNGEQITIEEVANSENEQLTKENGGENL